uniref:(California timema) hypothetical protein n=1 Tax=Timema californicum TaxID=61474 RepID=A0A7R9PAS7_TIMCA|nr:unnamed protein product [Timema californicum]
MVRTERKQTARDDTNQGSALDGEFSELTVSIKSNSARSGRWLLEKKDIHQFAPNYAWLAQLEDVICRNETRLNKICNSSRPYGFNSKTLTERAIDTLRRGPPRHTIPDEQQLVLSRGRDTLLVPGAALRRSEIADRHSSLHQGTRRWHGFGDDLGMEALTAAMTVEVFLPFPVSPGLRASGEALVYFGETGHQWDFTTSAVSPLIPTSGGPEARVSDSTAATRNLFLRGELGGAPQGGVGVAPQGGFGGVPLGGLGGFPEDGSSVRRVGETTSLAVLLPVKILAPQELARNHYKCLEKRPMAQVAMTSEQD